MNEQTGDTGDGAADLPVNPQIIDAVKQTQEFILGTKVQSGDEVSFAATIAYQKVTQAAAFSVQDATDYLRNIMSISSTAQGVVLKLMIEHKEEAPLYAPIIAEAQAAVTAAQANLAAVGTTASDIVSSFPKS